MITILHFWFYSSKLSAKTFPANSVVQKKACCELRIALHPISFNIFICLRSADLLTATLRDQDREDKRLKLGYLSIKTKTFIGSYFISQSKRG
jgi:hypothetical protein